MSRMSSVSRKDVIDLLKRLAVEMIKPTPLVFPEAEDGLDDVGDLFEVPLPPSKPPREPGLPVAATETVSGTKPITIRLHLRVINAFKTEAIKTGTSYQTLMHRVLADAAEELAL